MGLIDEMTKGVTQRKDTAAGPTLTPVGVEASPIKPSLAGVPEVDAKFLTNEYVVGVARSLREAADAFVAIANDLDNLTTIESTATDSAETKRQATKAAEQEADEKFSDRFKRLQQEAQASLTDDTVGEPHEGNPNTPLAWECPTHGDASLQTLTSGRTKREYLACTQCKAFQPAK